LSTAIRFDHVSKRFTLHHQRPQSFQELVIRTFKRGGHPSEQQGKHAEALDVPRYEAFWALRDVSFTLDEGDTLGIIGPNGAGKSTVLKLVARIIQPDGGEVSVNGRVGALLELGTGFHPDLSGRENIYLNGSILGLSRSGIDRKLTDIIDFAELQQFIDMPVKHYSSGMRMRLGFSIAAHIEPEVLLIDEVLAVGDENFQHKCLDRVMDLRGQGVTICFVSHSLESVARLCSRGIWLNHGVVEADGNIDDVISAYRRHAADEEEDRLRMKIAPLQVGEEAISAQGDVAPGLDVLEITDVSFLDSEGEGRHVFHVDEPWNIRLSYAAPHRVEEPVFGFTMRRNDGIVVCSSTSNELDIPFAEGAGEVYYSVDQLPLMQGTYLVSVSVQSRAHQAEIDYGRTYDFRVRQVGEGERYGLTSLGGRWNWQDGGLDLGTSSVLDPECSRDRTIEARSETSQRWGAGGLDVVGVSFIDASGHERRVYEYGESWKVVLRYRADRIIERPVFGLAIHREDGLHICGPNTYFAGLDIASVEGEGEVSYQVDHLPLLEGSYFLSVSAHNRADTVMYDFHDRLHPFGVCQFDLTQRGSAIRLKGRWSVDDGIEGGSAG